MPKWEANTIYYTILNMSSIELPSYMKTNKRIETIRSQYVLFKMLEHLGINATKIHTAASGKPFFNKSDINFNYSHSNNFIACAVSLHEVGIDIEENDRRVNKSTVKICGLNCTNPLEELIKRESFCKMTGQGIALIFDKNNFKDLDKYCRLFITKEYTCSICGKEIKPVYKFINIIEL